jgi:hypothetical protein
MLQKFSSYAFHVVTFDASIPSLKLTRSCEQIYNDIFLPQLMFKSS